MMGATASMTKAAIAPAKRADLLFSQDELNLAEFPFGLLTSRAAPERRSITVEREVHDPATGRTVRQRWAATGSAEHGLPTAADMDVYVALMQIASRNGIDRDRKVHFRRLELVKLQGLRPCQSAYDQLERSIQRLKGVSITTEDAFFDARARRRTSQGFGIIDNYKFEDSRFRVENGEGEQLEFLFQRSWVRLNEVLYEQLTSGGIKSLDTEVYYKLDYPVSRRLYRFLDRMRERSERRYEIDLDLVARLMPLHDSRPSRQLRDLEKAHEELVKAGYLEGVTRLAGKDGFRLAYAFAPERLEPVVQTLVDRGISASVAKDLASRFPPELIEKKVEAFDRLPKSGNVRNPAGYLRRSIEQDWKEATRALESEKGEKTEPRSARTSDPTRVRQRELRELFLGLEPARQREVDERALERARAELGAGAKDRQLALAVLRKREEILREEYVCSVTGSSFDSALATREPRSG